MYPEMVDKMVLRIPSVGGLESGCSIHTVDQHYVNELRATYETTREYQLVSYYDNNWNRNNDELGLPAHRLGRAPEYPFVAMNNALTADMIFTQPVMYEFQYIQVPTLLINRPRDRTAIGRNHVRNKSVLIKWDLPILRQGETQRKFQIPDW